MGVHDLALLIKRFSPNSVTRYASLSDFQGSTFAIDAHLLTLRFHFATEYTPDDYRHARAWYAFLTSLKQQNIKPIVVFDGETRLPAKAKENLKRVGLRESLRNRAAAEAERSFRLSHLRDAWQELENNLERIQVLKAGREMVAGVERTEVLTGESESLVTLFSELRKGMLEDSSTEIYSPRQNTLREQERSFHESMHGRELEKPVEILESVQQEEVAEPEPQTVESSNMNKAIEEELIDSMEESSQYNFLESLDPIIEVGPPQQPIQNDLTETIQDQVEAMWHESQAEAAMEKSDAMTRMMQTDSLTAMVEMSDLLAGTYGKRSERINPIAFTSVFELIQSMGIPWIKPSPESPHEAEGICSTLVHDGLADFVVSEDSDVAVYGAKLLRRISTSSQNESKSMNVLDPIVLRRELGVTDQQFLDLSLLCGTDFTERIPGLGPIKALKFILKYGSIEAILSEQAKYRPIDQEYYLETIREARSIFLERPTLPLEFCAEPKSADPYLSELLHTWNIEQ